MTDAAINEIANLIVFAVTIPAVANAAIYGIGSAWWRSWLGRVLFSKWLSVALVFVFILTRRMWGDYPGYGWWAVGLYTFVFLSFAATTAELIIERRAPADVVETPIRKAVIMTTQNNNTGPLVVGETVTSDSEKVTLGTAKAIVATIATAISMGLGALAVALADEVVTTGEWVTVGIALLAGTGLVGGTTYAAKTTVTRER